MSKPGYIKKRFLQIVNENKFAKQKFFYMYNKFKRREDPKFIELTINELIENIQNDNITEEEIVQIFDNYEIL